MQTHEAVESSTNIDTTPIETMGPFLRDGILRQLFDTDYDFVQESGVLDAFHYDPVSCQDGLLHTLVGDYSGGFHSEAAAYKLGINDPNFVASTRVDTDLIESPRQRRACRQWPFEPYKATVILGGAPKKTITDNAEIIAPNSMFPREYDPTAIVRTIWQAYANRDKQDDEIIAEGYDMAICAIGSTALIDGSAMQVRMFLHPDTERIMSAHPVTSNNGSRTMNCSPETVATLLGV